MRRTIWGYEVLDLGSFLRISRAWVHAAHTFSVVQADP